MKETTISIVKIKIRIKNKKEKTFSKRRREGKESKEDKKDQFTYWKHTHFDFFLLFSSFF
mgnify:FL=1